MLDWLPKEKKAYIYAIWDNEDRCIYIGSTLNPNQRFSKHEYKKLGNCEVIDVVSLFDRGMMENHYIGLALDCCEPLLNRSFNTSIVDRDGWQRWERLSSERKALRLRCKCMRKPSNWR